MPHLLFRKILMRNPEFILFGVKEQVLLVEGMENPIMQK